MCSAPRASFLFLILYSKGLFVFMQRNLSKSRGKKHRKLSKIQPKTKSLGKKEVDTQ